MSSICAALTNTNVSNADCLAMPAFAEAFKNKTSDLTWKRYEVTEDSGYILGMVRVTGDSSNAPAAAASKGPVLLMSPLKSDGTFYVEDSATNASLAERLFNEGYDVWIVNRRGTRYSDGNTDGAISEEDYWNFVVKDIAGDTTALIAQILSERQTEGKDCLKVSILSDTEATMEVTRALADYPTGSSAYIAQALLRQPCWIRETSYYSFLVGEETEFEIDPACAGQPARDPDCDDSDSDSDCEEPITQECKDTWDSKLYNNRYNALKKSLSYSDRKEFDKLFKEWRQDRDKTGLSWKYGGLWERAFDEILCEIDDEDDSCVPEQQRAVIDYLSFLEDNDINVLNKENNGKAWSDIVEEDLCPAFGEDSQVCLYNQWLVSACPDEIYCNPPVSTKYFSDHLQNSFNEVFAKFNPDYSMNGWYEPLEEIDLDTINVPLKALFLEGDSQCNYEDNKMIWEGIPTAGSVLTFNEGSREPFNFAEGVDDEMVGAILALLAGMNAESVEGDCATLDFSDWA